MAGLCWMAVMLVWFLSAGNSLAVVDQNDLPGIIKEVRKRYNIMGQVSFAVNIPVDQDLKNNKLEKVFEKDPPDTVKEKVSKDEVYQGTNVVAAKFKKSEKFTEHAEARVLDNIKPLADRSQDHFLVFYSYLSPCGKKCTNKDNKHNILDKIQVISKWEDYAFVFYKVFDKTQDGTVIEDSDIVEALKQLGETEMKKGSILKDNIFRCYKPQNKEFQCIKCYSKGKLSEECVKNEA